MPYHTYSAWETDQVAGPAVSVGAIRPHERALIYRRRVGRRQVDVARDLNICVFTLRKMEMGLRDPTPLLEYWEN